MKLLLDFGLLNLKSVKSLELHKKTALAKLFEEFRGFDLFKQLRFFGIEADEKKIEINSEAVIARELKSLKLKSYVVADTKDDMEATIKISFSLRETHLRLRLIVDPAIDNFNSRINELIEVYKKFHDFFAGKIEFPFVSAILDWDETDYEKPGKPVVWRQFNEFGLVDIIHFSKSLTGDEKLIENKLRNAPLPSGVERNCNKDYCVINWVGKVSDPEGISAGLSVRANWFYENADLPADTNYNEFGDELFSIVNPVTTPHFTFYSNFRNAGYKATVLGKNNDYDKALFKELKKWLEQGKTPDGKLLSQVNLILPKRSDAIAIKPIADQHGFNRVLYPAGDGNFWNPFP